MRFSRKKFETPLLRIPVRKVKVIGIPEGVPKFEGETRISRGVNAKKRKIPGGHEKIDWKSRGFNFKRDCYPQQGVTIFSGKAQIKVNCKYKSMPTNMIKDHSYS